jgi:hypothetical protein
MFIINKETLLVTVDSVSCLMKQLEMLGCVSNLAGSASSII